MGGLSAGTVGEASTALSSAAQVALQSLSHAMVSAEQQLQVLQEKQQQLLKLQQQVKDKSTVKQRHYISAFTPTRLIATGQSVHTKNFLSSEPKKLVHMGTRNSWFSLGRLPVMPSVGLSYYLQVGMLAVSTSKQTLEALFSDLQKRHNGYDQVSASSCETKLSDGQFFK